MILMASRLGVPKAWVMASGRPAASDPSAEKLEATKYWTLNANVLLESPAFSERRAPSA